MAESSCLQDIGLFTAFDDHAEEIDRLHEGILNLKLDQCSNGMHFLSITSGNIEAQNIKLLIQKQQLGSTFPTPTAYRLNAVFTDLII